ncbi:outer membrane beta-barrel family protein [Chryseobacterium camelliae]|uniref:outer membrane beta-barrel family protein n=1 Tax=Chryseobacterium camelliae TaxID=1265445 RepID=UPI00285EFDD9|nr:outer membrane beta-barrel family protein [Chryseobacterium camelliae]MDR6514776.1 outer membrane receptor protein involved in Fe transport [Chryseobacterium camelliae]
MKIRITAFIFFLGFLSFYNAQSITGKISDDHQIATPYAEIILKKDKITKSAISDENGNFTVQLPENGMYQLNILLDGNVVYSENLNVDSNIDKTFTVKKMYAGQIQEVKLTARKKVIERKVDRMIFNVENSIASQGMSTLDALRNTPLVRIQNDNISIVGKNGVSIMINDKIVNLSGTELINFIQSLRSDNVSKIEVITTPPSKYEAQGNSGIINIVLKKNTNLGWSGNFSTSYVRRSENGYSNNATLNYQNQKLNSSLKLRQYDNRKRSSEVNSIESFNSLFSDDQRLDMNKGIGINISTEYLLSDRSKVGFIYDFGDGDQNMDIRNISEYKISAKTDSLLSTYAEHRQKSKTHMMNLYYDYKIDSLGRKLSFNVNYFANDPTNEINFVTTNMTSQLSERYRSFNGTKYKVWSAQSDLTLPLQWATVETGLKLSIFDNKSDLRYYKIDDVPIILPGGTNLFNYYESNYAAYFSAEKKISDQWTAKAGLRYEYSVIDGESPLTAEREKYNYGQLFPTAYVAYKPNNDNVFTISYSRRINRPFFRALNPNRWYTNPYTFAKGNPLLRPSYNNNIDFAYSFKSKLNLSLYYQRTSNAFSQLVTYVNTIKTIDYANMYNENNIGIDASYYDTFFKIWEVNVTANAYHTKSVNTIPQIVGQKSFNFYYSINNTVSIGSSKNVQLFMNYSQMLPGTFGNYRSDGYSMLNIGGKLSLMDKKMQINVFVEDVFKKAISQGQSVYADFIMKNRNYYDLRSFNISVNYSFGNSKVKGANRNINFDEKNRAK